MKNALTLSTDLTRFSKTEVCAENDIIPEFFTVAAKQKSDIISNKENYEFYKIADDEFLQNLKKGDSKNYDKLFLPSLLIPEKDMDAFTDCALNSNSKLIIGASRTLYEVGYFDSKYNLSPVMLLNKLGLLENNILVGGVHLDNDDIDLMVQQNASLIINPSFDAGEGNGVANIKSYFKRGLKISIGTYSSQYNKNESLSFEAELLNLMLSAILNEKDVLKNIGAIYN